MKAKNQDKEYICRYEKLFSNDDKAEMFDVIAEQFFAGNFGRMSKTDFETMMFSIYIEQILKREGDKGKNFSAYSDYKLAKELGISQSKVSSLKMKKQLQYPYEYDWRESFANISDRARYENGKIKIQIPDINLYYEIKNAVEENGGFIEMTLTRGLLIIQIEYFLDLMEAIVDESDRKELRKCIRAKFKENQKDQELIESKSIGEQLKSIAREQSPNLAVSILSGIITTLDGGGASKMLGFALKIMKSVIETIPGGK